MPKNSIPSAPQTFVVSDTSANESSPEPSAQERILRSPGWLVLLAANWRILLAGTCLAAALAALPQVTAPRQYVAESLIVPTASWTQVQFEPKIKTVDSASGQDSSNAAFTPERRQALVDLIRSSTIEQKVLQRLSQSLPASELQPGAVVQHISGGLKPRSEILGIQAVSDSPDSAVALVGAWATAYVEHVNQVYTPPNSDASIVQLRDQAQATLREAQDALTASFSSSRLEALDQQITTDEQLLTLIQIPYQTQAQAPAQQPQTSATPQRPDTTTSSGSSTLDSSSGQLNDYRLAERRTLDDIAQTLRRLDATRQSVRALMSGTAATSNGSANAAAVSLLKAQLVSISGGFPFQIQFQLPVSDTGASSAELQALVASIEQARAEVASELEQRRRTYEAHQEQQVAALNEELRGLRSQREAADAERKQLTMQRDLYMEAYNALARKAEETRVAHGTQARAVELASQANFAVPVPRISWPALAAGGLGGLVASAALVLSVSFVRATGTGRQRHIHNTDA